jgi:putative ABC transport system substrate-binding protein
MGRREFLGLIGGIAAAWPLAGRAQQPGVPAVGFLRVTSQADSANLVAGFRQGLREASFVDGQNRQEVQREVLSVQSDFRARV